MQETATDDFQSPRGALQGCQRRTAGRRRSLDRWGHERVFRGSLLDDGVGGPGDVGAEGGDAQGPPRDAFFREGRIDDDVGDLPGLALRHRRRCRGATPGSMQDHRGEGRFVRLRRIGTGGIAGCEEIWCIGTSGIGVRDAEQAWGDGVADAFALTMNEWTWPMPCVHADDVVVLVDARRRRACTSWGMWCW